MPEEGYSYTQQLGLEFVKSQYGAVVMGALAFPVFGITLATILAPIVALVTKEGSAGFIAAVEGLTPLQWLNIIINPGSASVYLGVEYAKEILKFDLVNLLKKALGL